MKKRWLQFLALLLSIAMLTTLVPVSAFAADAPDGGTSSADSGDATLPEDGGDTALPEDGWDNALPEDGGDTALPEDGGDNALPEDGGDTALPEDGGDATLPEDGGDATLPEDGGDATLPEDGGDNALPEDGLSAEEEIMPQSDTGLTIEGYTRVTELPAGGLSGKYLIVVPCNDSYYMLYPGATGGGLNVKNAAKLVVGADGAATGYKVNVPDYNDTEAKTDFSAAENTIAKSDTNYSVTAVGPGGTAYYLFNGGNPVYHTASPSTLTIEASSTSGYFHLRNSASNRAFLCFYATDMNYNQSGGTPDNRDLLLFKSDSGTDEPADDPLAIPGYNQVTAVSQIKADRKYLVVAQAPNGTLYALRISADGANNRPGASAYPNCAATLTVSGGAVSAVNTAETGTSIPMEDLHLTIAPSGNNYTVKNDTHCLALVQNEMYHASSEDISLELSFVADSRFNIYNRTYNRYLTFNVNGDTATSHYPTSPTGFCGWSDAQPNYIPIYLYIEGDLPAAEPGSALAGMLSGDQIGDANGNTDPAGQNSWVFTGGRAAQGSFADVAGARTWAGHFEEYVRYTHAKQLQPQGEATTPYFQRHVINAAYEGQKLADIVSSFDTRIGALKPRAVVYLVDENASSDDAQFSTSLNSLITKALALRGGTGMIVIETLTQADKTAVDTVVNALDEGLNPRVLSVLATLTDGEKTGGYPNAQGHLAMAKQLADAVAGRTVSTADRWPFTLSNSDFTANWPVKETVTANHDGYGTPTNLTTAQQALKDKMTAKSDSAMTWLFMGDSITHGSAWTGGYDSLAQLFEKFVKDDLGRKQDIVINAGSSGASTASTISDLDRRLIKYSPDVVVLMLGTNNSGVSDDQYKANIRTLLDAIIAKGAVPVLRTPPPAIRGGYGHIATRAGLIETVAAEAAYENNVILVDQYTAWTSSNWRDAFTTARDDLHPDEAGHLWFAHQLINEMGLWKSDSAICNLEYVAREEQAPVTAPEIPGYTQLTNLTNLNERKGYMIVSRDQAGNLYALYPSDDGKTLGAGVLPTAGTANEGARAASLTVDGENVVTAEWLKDGSSQSLEKLLFTIKRGENGGYIFTSFNGRHLNMEAYMFTDGSVELTVTNLGTAVLNSFEIKNTNSGRVLDFNKYGDSSSFNGGIWGTDFWCPKGVNVPVYLFASNTATVPTAKEGIETLIREDIADLNEDDYTLASWANLQTAQAAAQNELEKYTDDMTGDEPNFVTARDNLQSAYDNLHRKAVIPTLPDGATKIENWKTMVPANGTTENEPFASGTGGSAKFRIPAIITLKNQTGANASKNGRLLAAIDARWDHTGDACSLDTIVSYSDDNGGNWNYNFANYFGDSTNAKATYGATFIDPQFTEGKDGTIFLMVDVYPGGVALNTAPAAPEVSTGFTAEEINGAKRMMLFTSNSGQTDDNYDYYVGAFTGGYAPVMEPLEGADAFSGFYVDEYYYLYKTGGDFAGKTPANDKIYCQRLDGNNNTDTYIQQNVFFSNASLHVRRATFLWIVKSTDGGETWSAPQIINDQVHQGDYRFYGVGPGAGLCVRTEGSTNPNAIPDGTLVFPIYNNTGETARFLYSTDNGVHWHMGNTATVLGAGDSSESCLVQIDDVTIRQFYRDGWGNSGVVRYTDHTWNGDGWVTGQIVRVEGAARWGACQLSAIKYSKQVDGKDLILYSAPGGNGRNTGIIHALLVNEDKTLTLHNTYHVNGNEDYKYSSLTETKDGDIALLYEGTYTDAKGDLSIFEIIPITELIPTINDPTGVALTPTTATIFTNTTETAERKHTVQLTASVLPSHANQAITWSSSKPSVATVSNTGLVTAVGNGTAIITATSSSDKTVFATCTVTVATRIESITVKKDGAAIGSGPVKVYTNANDDGHSVTLTAESVPAEVTHPALNWTRPDGAKGQITLSDRGENGRSITITAVPGEKNVGEVTVEVASADHPDTKTSFKVHVIRKLENNVSISIRGVNDPARAPQCGQTLEADINDLQMTDTGKDALTYQWKRTKGGTTTNIGTGDKTYVLTQDDVGAVISVDVTAGVNSFYEGTRSATRRQPVEKADGPLTGPQGLTGTAPSATDATDGSITGFDGDFANYEYRLAVTDGVENEWTTVSAATIENLAAGTYQVRAKETDTHKAGGFSVVTVPAYNTTTFDIKLDAMTNGRVSRSASVAEETDTVTLTVLPETGYRLAAGSLSVEKSDGTNVTVTKAAGKDNEYTFTMPGEAVTVKATFEQLMFTITHELTHLHCSRGASDGHQVPYGESTAITLVPDEGYALPLRKDITITNSRGVKITGWTINDKGVIEITGGVTSDLVIVAVGRPDTHTVNYTLTNGLSAPEATAPRSVGHLAAYAGTIEAETGFKLPETIVVTVGGSLIGAENYLYNKETGEISISEGKISGDVVITATGVPADSGVVSVTGVTLDMSEASLTVGSTLTLTATVAPENATTKNVVWSTGDDSIATVDENGMVTGKAEGDTVITVMTLDGRYTASCTVTVSAGQSGDSAAKLTGLTVKNGDADVTLTPAFASDTKTYTASVENNVESVTVTGIPDTGATVTVKKGADACDNGVVALAVGENVVTVTVSKDGVDSTVYTVTITRKAGSVTVDKAALNNAIEAANTAKLSAVSKPDGTTAADVDEGVKFVTETDLKALTDAIAAAEEVAGNGDATQDEVDAAVTALNAAVEAFKGAIKTGTYTPRVPTIPNKPPISTEVEKNPDGSTTTTVTDKKTGTVTETTERPDGTKEIVETKKDGTVTETTEKPDGSKQIVETLPDGTVTETAEEPDGSKEVVETKPDGTVTETKTDTEGGEVAKVTDPDKNVEIKVTDPSGEVLAEVKLPAETPVPENRFVDVPENHWADEAVHEMAGLGLVNGVGDNKFDMSSNMKRGDLALILSRLSNAKTDYELTFTDVPAGKYYANGVAWAAKSGVVTGRSADKFDPEATITRGELAVMLYRYAKLLKMDTTASAGALEAFKDGSTAPDWAADSLAWCVENGILKGKGGGILDSTATTTRAEVAVMLQRFVNLMK